MGCRRVINTSIPEFQEFDFVVQLREGHMCMGVMNDGLQHLHHLTTGCRIDIMAVFNGGCLFVFGEVTGAGIDGPFLFLPIDTSGNRCIPKFIQKRFTD